MLHMAIQVNDLKKCNMLGPAANRQPGFRRRTRRAEQRREKQTLLTSWLCLWLASWLLVLLVAGWLAGAVWLANWLLLSPEWLAAAAAGSLLSCR